MELLFRKVNKYRFLFTKERISADNLRYNYEKYKNLSNLITKVIRYKKRQLEKRICKSIKKDPTALYTYVKQKMKV